MTRLIAALTLGAALAAAPAPEEVQAAWMRAATPGAPHLQLAAMAGDWDTRVTRWMDPAKPPVQARGKASYRMVLDGRFLEERVESEMAGRTFLGLGLIGYDNIKERYTSSWADNMSTSIFTMLGDCNPDRSICRFAGNYDDALTGKSQTMRLVITATDPDRRVGEFYPPGPDGREFKGMEIVYNRRR
jgi:hypothetical protein